VQDKSDGIVGLSGIDYHPKGVLLVGHTSAGALFKVSIDTPLRFLSASVLLIDQ
jgi:hypothetical protein